MIVDIIVGAVLLVSAIIAFIRGLIREVLTIFGVVGGFVAAYSMGGWLSPIVEGWFGVEEPLEEGVEAAKLFDLIPYPLVADAIAYGGIFLVVVGLLSVVSHFLSEASKKLGLGAVDRTLGVIFGILRGVLLLGLLYLPVYMLASPKTKESWFSGARSYIYLEKTSALISHFLPGQDKENLEKDFKTIGDALSTREKLQELDVLRRDQGEETSVPSLKKGSIGYDEHFRDKMDELFEGEILPLNE